MKTLLLIVLISNAHADGSFDLRMKHYDDVYNKYSNSKLHKIYPKDSMGDCVLELLSDMETVEHCSKIAKTLTLGVLENEAIRFCNEYFN